MIALRYRTLYIALLICCVLATFGAAQTKSPTQAQSKSSEHADAIVILKKDHLLQLYYQGKLIRTYKVALGSGGLAPKQREGDARTPEGHYVIDLHNANSKYHKSLHISYPNADDQNRARKGGYSPGGAIMIHGLPDKFAYMGALHRQWDWTLGCVAVTDDEIDEIWNLVPNGTSVDIRP